MVEMEVLKPGSKTTIPAGDAVVLSVNIGIGGVRYELGYWSANEWKEIWLPDSEVKIKQNKPMRIGFQKQ